jgi:hypothetical protein
LRNLFGKKGFLGSLRQGGRHDFFRKKVEAQVLQIDGNGENLIHPILEGLAGPLGAGLFGHHNEGCLLGLLAKARQQGWLADGARGVGKDDESGVVGGGQVLNLSRGAG